MARSRCRDSCWRRYVHPSNQELEQAEVTFIDAFAYIVGEEGKLSMDPEDPGNWTGHAKGVGILKGTKYGISAAAYPLLDIANLSLSDAQAIYQRDYWNKLGGDSLPWGNALCLFDFGVNAGISEAARVAQRALGLTVDGVLGPNTLGTIRNMPPQVFAPLFTQYRIAAYHLMAGFEHEGAGWIARANLTEQKAVT
jgi:lysozyme family protein